MGVARLFGVGLLEILLGFEDGDGCEVDNGGDGSSELEDVNGATHSHEDGADDFDLS